ncbi:hypothetical protein HF325_000742 [Metschnikowia pulcherrima]|uniref:Rgp1-domain-containing protein n=1 Tax=Metschnikowia pulcherrima TaxID=27326 RepID=A0A8H7GWX4_9ASCO|nr:hypothetical protein HF325_000742 [Metschnikowia pulcherrima]
MPQISPINHRFTKKVNDSLEISLEYQQAPNSADKFDCVLEFINVNKNEDQNDHSRDENDTNVDTRESASTEKKAGWLSSLWGSEKSRLVEEKAPEVPLLLGYIQMLGYARLNHQIGADTGSESSLAVFWKNSEYVSSYCSAEADEKVQQILETELFSDGHVTNKNDTETAETTLKLARIEGVPDLHAKRFDATAHYLLHDLAHPFNTMGMPKTADSLTIQQQDELSSSLSRFVVPFYVTAQHLVFASTSVAPGGKLSYKFRVDVPPETLPPSYNTKLTGSVGDAGLASIAYSFVVGMQENVNNEMKHRAVYFPFQFRPGHFGLDRGWLQHDYLKEPLMDRKWCPETVSDSRNDRKIKKAIHDGNTNEASGILDILPLNLHERNGAVSESHPENGDPIEHLAAIPRSNEIEEDANALDSVDELPEPTPISATNPSDDSGAKSHEKESLVISDKISNSQHNEIVTQNATSKAKFVAELDSLIEGSLESLAAKERRKSSVSYANPADRHLISQMPEKPRVSYQIKVNNQSLCVLTMSNSTYHVGDDVHFSIKLHPEFRTPSRVVGFTSHIEAHEIFHIANERKIVNIYKVTPTIKANTYADAVMFPFSGDPNPKTGAFLNLPRFLTQQFQLSAFMDLRYFMVFRFVLNQFPEMESCRIDEDPKAFTEYLLAYKVESEANEFRFSIPLTVLPCV